MLNIKNLEWSNDGYAFFCNGHIDKEIFVAESAPSIRRELGDALDEDVKPADVRHTWFRTMSPPEARDRGYDSGYLEVEEPTERRGNSPFPVTLVVL